MRNHLIAAAALALLNTPTAQAQMPGSDSGGGPSFKLGKDSHLWVEGDSTLHKFRLDSKDFKVQVSVAVADADAGPRDLLSPGALATLSVQVPVRELASGDSGLDDNMRGTLKADHFAEIRFQMDSYRSTPGPDTAHLTARIKGRLQIAGVEKPVELDALVAWDGTGLHVTGATQLLMSTFGVKPPTFMLVMTVSDQVTVHFDLHLEATR